MRQAAAMAATVAHPDPAKAHTRWAAHLYIQVLLAILARPWWPAPLRRRRHGINRLPGRFESMVTPTGIEPVFQP
jgi:hypothetical protein